MSILAPENSVEIIRGSSLTLRLSVTDEGDKPVNLSGAQIYFTVKVQVEDVDPVFQKSTHNASELEIDDATGGVARVYITPADTQKLDARKYFFDVWVILNNGRRFPVIPVSEFVVKPGVTVIPL